MRHVICRRAPPRRAACALPRARDHARRRGDRQARRRHRDRRRAARLARQACCSARHHGYFLVRKALEPYATRHRYRHVKLLLGAHSGTTRGVAAVGARARRARNPWRARCAARDRARLERALRRRIADLDEVRKMTWRVRRSHVPTTTSYRQMKYL